MARTQAVQAMRGLHPRVPVRHRAFLFQGFVLASCSAIVLVLLASAQRDGLTDAEALALQATALGTLLFGFALTLLLSRRPSSRRAAIALKCVPLTILAIAFVTAKTSYADVSVELEALREARLPRPPETRLVLGPGAKDVRLAGEITDGVAARLAALLDANPTVTRIHLTSEGGLADEGQALGDVIAAHRIVTFVPDYCVSACTLAFVRGRERLVLADSRLGFHAPYQPGLFGQIVQGEGALQRDAYIGAGVARDFAEAALKVPSSDVWIPDPARLLAAHVATGIVDRYRFPDSSLDEGATREAARAQILRNFPILLGLEPKSRTTDAIAGWYLAAYRAGRSEGALTDGLRRIVGATVSVAMSRADEAALETLAHVLAAAIEATPSTARCVAIGTHADLLAASATARAGDIAGGLLRRVATLEGSPARKPPLAVTTSVALATSVVPAPSSPATAVGTRLGPTCADVRKAYAAMLARPGAAAASLGPIVQAEARRAAEILATMGRDEK